MKRAPMYLSWVVIVMAIAMFSPVGFPQDVIHEHHTYRDGNGSIWDRLVSGGTESAPTKIADFAASDPVVTVYRGDQYHVTWRDSNGIIWDTWYLPDHKWSSPAKWTGPGNEAAGGPVVTIFRGDQYHVTWRDRTGIIWDAWYHPSSGNNGPNKLNGPGTNLPRAATDPVVRVKDPSEYHVSWQDENGDTFESSYTVPSASPAETVPNGPGGGGNNNSNPVGGGSGNRNGGNGGNSGGNGGGGPPGSFLFQDGNCRQSGGTGFQYVVRNVSDHLSYTVKVRTQEDGMNKHSTSTRDITLRPGSTEPLGCGGLFGPPTVTYSYAVISYTVISAK